MNINGYKFAKMKREGAKQFLWLIIIVLCFSSCATFQKRRYNSGFALNLNKQNHTRIAVERIKYRETNKQTGSFTAIVVQQQREFRGEQADDCNKVSGSSLKGEQKIIEDDYKNNTLDFHRTLNISNYKEHLLPLKDSLVRKQDAKNELPKEPYGNLAFGLTIVGLFLLLISLLFIFSLESFFLGYTLVIIGNTIITAGFILGLISLVHYKDYPDKYSGKNLVIATVIISSLFSIASTIAIFSLFIYIIKIIAEVIALIF